MKRILTVILAAVLMLCGCSAQNANPDSNGDGVITYEDYSGKRFSILVGSIFDGVADEHFNPSRKLYFNNVVEEIEAVNLGKTDAALVDGAAAVQSLGSGMYPDLTTIDVPIEGLDLPYGVFSADDEIISRYNEFLAEIEADGTLKEMQDRWLNSYSLETVMPEIAAPENPSGTLKVAIMATYPPFTLLADGGEYKGFDIEQLRRFGLYINMDVEFIEMDFGAMLPFVKSGKADLGGSVYITPEREEAFFFSEPDFSSKTVLVVKKPQ
ncbi:MAG: transporter substrate-binding domain-containing protein [Ruminococcus sp.]|jgi:ABC-type amino acid transport substrate-binding protein|nr:transporter substrate-binding domain-containing protein [Ruminococcus sp.]